MTIEEAIDLLKEQKEKGVKNIILAWWDAQMFDQEDNDQWASAVNSVEDKLDWSLAHESISDALSYFDQEGHKE